MSLSRLVYVLIILAVAITTAESFEGWLVQLTKGMMQTTLDTTLVAWLTNLKQQAEKNCDRS